LSTLLPELVALSKSDQSKDEDLTDERKQGEWQTRYSKHAWLQIIIESIVLIFGLIICLYLFYEIAASRHIVKELNIGLNIFESASHHALALEAVAIGGACGGFAFALKWLYHGVAHGWWNRDRIVWRLIVPLLSATLALFTALMIGSGIIPIFSVKITEGPRAGAAYGFFVGFFSDNLVGALQRFANHTLGKIGRTEDKQSGG
jgi:hypothetical protein